MRLLAMTDVQGSTLGRVTSLKLALDGEVPKQTAVEAARQAQFVLQGGNLAPSSAR